MPHTNPIDEVEPELRQIYTESNVLIDESTLSNPGECLRSSYRNLAGAEGFFFPMFESA